MATKDQILAFFRDPLKFAGDVAPGQAALWLRALDEVAEPQIRAKQQFPLRSAQIKAWRAIADTRVALVLGPPGTGKTFALSSMAAAYSETRRAAAMPCKILVTGFTLNSIANLVDGLVERFQTFAEVATTPPIYFLGIDSPVSQMSQSVQLLSSAKKHLSSSWQTLQAEHMVVGCSVWSLYKLIAHNSPELATPLFDLVCIDEASQMPVSHGLLALAGLKEDGRVLVAGDDRQLAPIREVVDYQVDGRQLGGSLYQFLKSANVPEFPLEETFRMNAPLAYFPESQFYRGMFRSADEVAENRLRLKDDWREGLHDWQQILLDPENPVCVLMYDGPLESTANEFEQRIAVSLVAALWNRILHAPEESAAEFWSRRLAIISPHRAQNAAIRALLQSKPFGQDCVVETVDRVQGKERDAIIASYTVSDPEFAVAEGEFLFAPERLNVTITRAKTKLIFLVSRKLLEVVPEDIDVLDAAQVLRDFVFSTAEVWRSQISDGGRLRSASIRVRRFESAAPLPHMPESTVRLPEPEISPEIQELLDAIIKLANQDHRFASVTWTTLEKHVKQVLHRKELQACHIATLVRAGLIEVNERKGPYGRFFVIKPTIPARIVYPVDKDTVRERIGEAIEAARRKTAPRYDWVRNQFAWMADDRTDALLPLVEELGREGRVLISLDADGNRVLDVPSHPEEVPPSEPERDPLTDDDFRVLNAVEDIESRRVNFGILESWVTVDELTHTLRLSRDELADRARRLESHGFLLIAEADRLRSRVAELAREVRYVKQRFQKGDRSRRPYLVRGLKLEIIPRRKPIRGTTVSRMIGDLCSQHCDDSDMQKLLVQLQEMLVREWNAKDPPIAEFQAKAVSNILSAWVGKQSATAFVITADTGSGKTEAAVLPLIVGAARDLLMGVTGVRAMLTYPRIRLSANQAERICRYVAALRSLGFPPITVGIQNSQTPETLPDRFASELWSLVPGEEAYNFPFFQCPQCAGNLLMYVGANDSADVLRCIACNWNFAGWIGTKAKIRRLPPSLLLIVTESLHQWLHDQRYARVFGDVAPTTAPRALLADEIHLYTNIHGSQVGHTFRRLIHRASTNRPDTMPLAVGMSATLSDATKVWGSLSGCKDVKEITPTEKERESSVRGREYFYFVQPEVESRGKDVAGASTTIQSLMCLAHGMRRRTGAEGGFRGIVFLDSIDKLKRLHSDYQDAEEDKRLARLRTTLFDDDPVSGKSRSRCCGQPGTCDSFRDGECWYFANNDSRQVTARGAYNAARGLRVAYQPVYSGTTDKVDLMISDSDLVFATSSLEVGYDDPDIALVYQHYAPLNLASFIQRKGRGGRGLDDRPITGVTLSAYSPRDSWYFRRPAAMLDPTSFRLPLNMENVFVLRGQVLAAMFDGLARYSARTQEQFAIVSPDKTIVLSHTALAEADTYIRGLFGQDIYQRFECSGLAELWDHVQVTTGVRLQPDDGLRKWREKIPFIPNALFDTINLPAVRVEYRETDSSGSGRDSVRDREDITLALASCAPGNMTRRYGVNVQWIPPHNGRAPFLLNYKDATAFGLPSMDQPGAPQLMLQLPVEARGSIGREIYPKVCRPTVLTLEQAGTPYQIDWLYDGTNNCVVPFVGHEQSGFPKVSNKTRSSLRGFVAVQADPTFATPLQIDPLQRIVEVAEAYISQRATGNRTGLVANRLYWGADIDIRTEDGPDSGGTMTQFFVHPRHPDKVLFHGYSMRTEGFRVRLKTSVLDEFVDADIKRVVDTGEETWLRARLVRFLLQSRGSAGQLNLYDLQRISELLFTAYSHPAIKLELANVLRRWDEKTFLQLMLATHSQALIAHPLLSTRRIGKLLNTIQAPGFRDLVKSAFESAADTAQFRAYIRSLVLHGLAVRLKQAFVLFGFGDESRVLVHLKLPVQFGADSTDIITVFENGEYGDGTTRTFVQNITAAFDGWAHAGIAYCSNAKEDTLMDTVANMEANHPEWRTFDPRNEGEMRRLGADLHISDDSDHAALQAAIRLLYGHEEIYGERFDYLDLFREATTIKLQLMRLMKRDVSIWEHCSAAVTTARTAPQSVPHLSRLLQLYGHSDELGADRSLTPEARLAEQVYRLSASLCVDGCRACLPSDSDLMSDSLAGDCLSRRVLARFSEAI